MPGPLYVEQTLWRGASRPPLVWMFGPETASAFALGVEFRLEITWLGIAGGAPVRGGLVARSPATLAVDRSARQVLWFYSDEQSRAIRPGIVRHELVGLAGGTERPWAWGPIGLRSGAAWIADAPLPEPAPPEPDNGGGSGAGPAPRYEHLQAAPAAVWTVPHNLGHRPLVEVLSPGGVRMIASIVHLSTHTLQVVLDDPMPGYAICI